MYERRRLERRLRWRRTGEWRPRICGSGGSSGVGCTGGTGGTELRRRVLRLLIPTTTTVVHGFLAGP